MVDLETQALITMFSPMHSLVGRHQSLASGAIPSWPFKWAPHDFVEEYDQYAYADVLALNELSRLDLTTKFSDLITKHL